MSKLKINSFLEEVIDHNHNHADEDDALDVDCDNDDKRRKTMEWHNLSLLKMDAARLKHYCTCNTDAQTVNPCTQISLCIIWRSNVNFGAFVEWKIEDTGIRSEESRTAWTTAFVQTNLIMQWQNARQNCTVFLTGLAVVSCFAVIHVRNGNIQIAMMLMLLAIWKNMGMTSDGWSDSSHYETWHRWNSYLGRCG